MIDKRREEEEDGAFLLRQTKEWKFYSLPAVGLRHD